jgi:chaperonin GroES
MYDRVAVELIDDPSTLPKRLVLPDTASRTSHLARVVAVGQGVVTKKGVVVPLEVAPGDVVFLRAPEVRSLGTEVVVHGKKLVLLRESQILGVIEEETR